MLSDEVNIEEKEDDEKLRIMREAGGGGGGGGQAKAAGGIARRCVWLSGDGKTAVEGGLEIRRPGDRWNGNA